MIKFSEYAKLRSVVSEELTLDFDVDLFLESNISNHQPKDGRWDRPPGPSSGTYTYRFNVEGDSNCGGEPCYSVNMSGSAEDGISVSFYRQSSTSDQHRGVGMEVFRGVLYGLGEYIRKIMPKKITWSAVSRSGWNPNAHKTKIQRANNNPEARASVYEGWAIRNLFPDKYVGMDGEWYRRDVYDAIREKEGFPPVPDNITADSSSSEKAKAHAAMAQQVKDHRKATEDNRQREERERRERYEQERRERAERAEREAREQQARIDAKLADPQFNPNGIKYGDIVYVEPESTNVDHHTHRTGKVMNIEDDGGDSELKVNIVFASEHSPDNYHSYYNERGDYSIKDVRKNDSAADEQRQQRRDNYVNTLLADPEKNPNGLALGDDIVSYMPEYPNHRQNGLFGKIRKFERDGSNIYALLDWDDHAKEVLGASSDRKVTLIYLRKATPEVVQEIKRKRREKEIEDEIQNNRERMARAQQRHGSTDEPANTPEEIEALVNDEKNPERLRPGEYVKVKDNYYREAGRRGIIVQLEKTSWGGNQIQAFVKFHGSNAAPKRIWGLENLERDNSQETQALRDRQQRSRDRLQRIQAGSNGFQIGDAVTVGSGIHRGKTGRIVSIRSSGANLNAVVGTHDGNITVKLSFLVGERPPAATPTPAVESNLSFLSYLSRRR